MSKNTGTDRMYPLPISATGARDSPNAPSIARTMRSAAPLSISALPMIAARAITMPMAPATVPKACATRVILTARSPGAMRLTTNAAMMSARKAFVRSTRIRLMTTATPTTRTTRGYKSIRRLPARLVR